MSRVATASGTAATGRAAPVPARRRGPATARLGRRRHLPVARVTAITAATVWLAVVLGPLYYMVLASLRSQGSYLTANLGCRPAASASATTAPCSPPGWAATCSTA